MKIKRFPDTLTIILAIMVLFIAMTWIIPAGEFDRETFGSKEIVIPGTYHVLAESYGQGLMDFLMAPIKGFQAAADIIAFVLLVGGAFSMVSSTGAINAALYKVIGLARRRPKFKMWVIPLIMTLFSLGGSTFGMAEEVLVFILITIPLARALGYDSIVGIAMPFIGAGAGFAGAFINPFTMGIAQGIAGLPIGSGFGYRLFCWFVFTSVCTGFVMWYAKRIEKNPELSLVHEIDSQRTDEDLSSGDEIEFNTKRKLVLALLTGAIALLLVGVNEWGWYIEEIAALFVGLGLVVAVTFRMNAHDASAAFVAGTKDVVTAAMVIGLSRGLLVLAEDGKIIDTMLFALSDAASGFPEAASIEIMFVFQTFLNFFIPSGSGQAALTMPLMAPLSDLLGITRQCAVLAYQFGDGISNLIIPTSGVTMGILEIAKVPYNKWFKWIMPLMIILTIVAALLLLPPTIMFDWN